MAKRPAARNVCCSPFQVATLVANSCPHLFCGLMLACLTSESTDLNAIACSLQMALCSLPDPSTPEACICCKQQMPAFAAGN
jgi:hypothetical protein